MARTWKRRLVPGMLALLGALGVAGCEEDGPPKVPHAVTGREDCLRCHDNPSPGNDAPQVPSDHAGRLENTCLPCHG